MSVSNGRHLDLHPGSFINEIMNSNSQNTSDISFNISDNGNFMTCTNCRHVWETRDQFLSDNSIKILGYQVDFVDLEEGLFLFCHDCGTTLSIPAAEFRDLYHGPVFSERLVQQNDCMGYCHERIELRACPLQCECAYIREILQIIKKWTKRQPV
jgi:hypothetical protein